MTINIVVLGQSVLVLEGVFNSSARVVRVLHA